MSARSNPLSYILSLESHAVGWKSVYAILELFIFKFQVGMNLLQPTGAWVCLSLQLVIRTYIPLFPEWLSEKMCTQQSRKVIGYDQYTVPDACSCRTYFCCFPLALANTFSWPLVPILSNFFDKKRTQNHPPFRIVACTFPDNLSWNSCILLVRVKYEWIPILVPVSCSCFTDWTNWALHC